MLYLLHIVNGDIAAQYELAGKLSIGRAETCDIRIPDGTVSSEHAVIEQAEGSDGLYQVRDLESTNGVFVNGDKSDKHLLAVGDVIRLGTHELEVVDETNDSMDRTTRIKKSWIPGVYYTEK